MGYNRIQAEALLNGREYELFAASLDDAIGDLDAAGLRVAIKRTRNARDKAKDLHDRQARTSGERAGGRGRALGANQRTAAKAAVFDEALTRLERRAERLERDAARQLKAERLAAARTAGRSAKPGAGAGNRAERRAAARGTTGRTGFQDSSAVASDVQRLDSPQAKHQSAARSAAGQRRQARRDAKG